MTINFTKAEFIYRETNINIYNETPVHVQFIPEPSPLSPFIVEFDSVLYEKCVYVSNSENNVNFFFLENGSVVRDVSITFSEEYATFAKYDNYFSLTVSENKSVTGRTFTTVAASNSSTITFKVFQEKVNPSVLFEKMKLIEYKNANDTIPVSETEDIPVGSSDANFVFGSLLEKNDIKKQELVIYCDVFVRKDTYLVNKMKKYSLDSYFNGDVVLLSSIPEHTTGDGPQYVECDGKTYSKTVALKNGKPFYVYEEGIRCGDKFYVSSTYDKPFAIKFNNNGTISIINYGRCFLEEKAFYIIEFSHKLSPKASAVIKLEYNS